MKSKTCLSIFFITLFTFTFCEFGFAQTETADYYNVVPGTGNGIRFWNNNNNNNNNNNYKIHMGSSSKYKYGPVTGFSIKTNMSNHTARGWTWGVADKVPVAALNTQGNFQVNGWMKNMSRTYYFGAAQNLYGDNSSALHWKSNHSTNTQLRFKDKEGTEYGRVFGSGNGVNFGLFDGDGNWSYLAVKDNYTAFRIDNNEKMRIKDNGNVGIGTINPTHKLSVNGTIQAKEVKVETGWSDYVFYDDYQLPTLEEEEKHIEENGYLLGFESEEDMGGEVSLGEVSRLQQAKIEEMMLHLIEMNKAIKQLREENKQLKKSSESEK